MRAVLVLGLTLALSHSATAQPALTAPTAPTPAFDYREARSPEYKDPNRAMWLSLGASAVGIGGMYLGYKMQDNGDTPIMMVGALVAVFGPSSGQWWVEGTPTFTPGFGIRLAGAAIAGLGLARAVDQSCNDNVCDAPLENQQSNALLGIGAATVLGGMIYDIATAGNTARRHNAQLQLSPQVVTTAHGNAPGLGISGRF
jgi:hypothetical protein